MTERSAPAEIEELLRPRLPHDDLSFSELARRYNHRLTSDRRRVFTRLVLRECRNRPAPLRVLDAGCGQGIGRDGEYLWAIRECAGEYWGIEPDQAVAPPQGLFDEHRHATIETAGLPAGHFDVVYSFMVMEHVERPDDFMAAVFECLKPGGVFLMATPNKRHYFARVASLLHTLRLDEKVLSLVRRGAHDYHYPVVYRFNDAGRIRGCAERIGFEPPELAYLEAIGPKGYFPAPLRPFFHLLDFKRRVWKKPESLVTLLCRVTRPQQQVR